jgi:hypothetical protein
MLSIGVFSSLFLFISFNHLGGPRQIAKFYFLSPSDARTPSKNIYFIQKILLFKDTNKENEGGKNLGAPCLKKQAPVREFRMIFCTKRKKCSFENRK